jgi:hypothetical protein
MSNDKAQMSSQVQNPKGKTEWFWHLSIWVSIVILIFGLLFLDFVWDLVLGI